MDELFARFMDLFGSPHYQQYDFDYPVSLRAANRISFASDALPYYDIRNCDYLLSFGADYLGTWISPVHHSLAYGHLRQGRENRGTTVQVEPRMSLSGANADQWIAARPGSEGALALGIGHELLRQGRYDGDDAQDWAAVLQDYSPAAVSRVTDVSADKISAIASDFSSSNASLAIAGGATAAGTNAVSSLVAVNALNHLVGNINQPGGVIVDAGGGSADRADSNGFRGMRELVYAMETGDVEVLILHDSNPMFALPESVGLRAAMEKVPLIIALSSFRDETSAMADIILPTNTYLESWGDDMPDPGVGFPVASLSQPVVAPLYDTLPAGDIILALARQIGGELPVELSWGSTEEFIKERWREDYYDDSADETGQVFDAFWQAALEAGVWGQPGAAREQSAAVSGEQMRSAIGDPLSEFAGDENEYPLVLHPYLTTTFSDGRGANLPWLQELPDPLTSVVYGSWAELNPQTAMELGIDDGDVLEVTSPAGTLRVPALTYPGIRPGVLAMPIGQGHSDYGRYASGRGTNPIHIAQPLVDEQSGELAWAATRVKLEKTGERVNIIRTGGVSRTLGRQILGPAGDHA